MTHTHTDADTDKQAHAHAHAHAHTHSITYTHTYTQTHTHAPTGRRAWLLCCLRPGWKEAPHGEGSGREKCFQERGDGGLHVGLAKIVYIYGVYIRFLLQKFDQMYVHIRCIYTALANPSHASYLGGSAGFAQEEVKMREHRVFPASASLWWLKRLCVYTLICTP